MISHPWTPPSPFILRWRVIAQHQQQDGSETTPVCVWCGAVTGAKLKPETQRGCHSVENRKKRVPSWTRKISSPSSHGDQLPAEDGRGKSFQTLLEAASHHIKKKYIYIESNLLSSRSGDSMFQGQFSNRKCQNAGEYWSFPFPFQTAVAVHFLSARGLPDVDGELSALENPSTPYQMHGQKLISHSTICKKSRQTISLWPRCINIHGGLCSRWHFPDFWTARSMMHIVKCQP